MDASVCGLLQALEQAGVRCPGVTPAPPVEFQLGVTDIAESRPPARVGADLAAAFSEWADSGLAVRCSCTETGDAAVAAAIPAQADTAIRWPDLDAAGTQQALPGILSAVRPVPLLLPVAATVVNAVGASAGDASVLRLSLGGVARLVALARRPARYHAFDAHRGAQTAVAEALRALACVGATPLAISYRIELAEKISTVALVRLKDGVRGLAEACACFNVPVAGAELDSARAPAGVAGFSLTVSAIGALVEERLVTSSPLRVPGHHLLLLGETPAEIGGSTFLAVCHGRGAQGPAPQLDLSGEKRLHKTLLALIKAGVVQAARDLHAGGALTAAAEMALAATVPLGLRLDMSPLGGGRTDTLLFGESNGRALVAVVAERVGTVLAESHMRGVPAALIGQVSADSALTLKTRAFAAEWSIESLRSARVSAACTLTSR